jgi:hypothetical protein
MREVEWPFEEGLNSSGGGQSTDKLAAANKTISDFVSKRSIDFMINLPIRGSGSYR